MGQTLIGTPSIKPAGTPDVYREYAPMTYMNGVKTPTLVVAEENDSLAPLKELEMIFAALKRVVVPPELIIYPRETHGLCEPRHVVNYMQGVVEWFDAYAPPPSHPVAEKQ